MPFNNTTIIGAGLAGLSLALLLEKQGLRAIIYERFDPSKRSEGALMLSPNGLRSLDTLGVYQRIRTRGYHFRDVKFNTIDHVTIDEYEMGHAEKFGYDALRIYRQVLLDELRAMAVEAGIDILYGRKFSHIVSEDEKGVVFALADGEEIKTDLLIAADGIHSTLRSYLAPDVVPAFQNAMGVSAALPTAKIEFPFQPYALPAGVHGPAGAFLMAPQTFDASEVFVGIQYRTHERTRAEWNALAQDKEQLYAMIQATYDTWNPMVKSAIDAIPVQTMTFWPYYSVPKLSNWSSTHGKVILIGDAAHAVPPSSGQGVNQAFEDAHTLSLVMAAGEKTGSASWNARLARWEAYRRSRIDRLDDLIDAMNKRRAPGWNGEDVGTLDSSWLFGVKVEEEAVRWLEEA